MSEIEARINALMMRRCIAILDRDYKQARALDSEIESLKVWQSGLLINQLWPGALIGSESMDLS